MIRKSIMIISILMISILASCARLDNDSNNETLPSDNGNDVNQEHTYIFDKPSPPAGFSFLEETSDGAYHYFYYVGTEDETQATSTFTQWIEALGALTYTHLPSELSYEPHDYTVFIDLHYRYYLGLFSTRSNNQTTVGILVFPLYHIEAGNAPLSDRYGVDSSFAPRYPEAIRIDYFKVTDYWDQTPYQRELNHYISTATQKEIMDFYRSYFLPLDYEIINEFDDLLEFKKDHITISVHVMRSLNFHHYHDIKVGVSDFSQP